MGGFSMEDDGLSRSASEDFVYRVMIDSKDGAYLWRFGLQMTRVSHTQPH